MKPILTIRAFDLFLEQRGESFSAIVIGGTALSLLGIITRETRDCDVLEPKLSEKILELSKQFAIIQTNSGNILRPDWLNDGPSSLVDELPAGWQSRVSVMFQGKALTLHTLSPLDLLRTKLFALCDRGTDRQDCIALKPTLDQIRECTEWVKARDQNQGWVRHVEETLKSLAEELGYEF